MISLAEASSLIPAPLSARNLWRHLTGPGPAGDRAARIPCNHFPLLLLGYSDYLQLADSVAHVLSSSRHAVLVFAPLFLLGTTIMVLCAACVSNRLLSHL